MGGVGELFAGTAVGTLFTMLYEVVKDVKDKTMIFKSLIGQLNSTLDSLKPLIEDIQTNNTLLDHPKEELYFLEVQMRKGIDVVRKCSKVGMWTAYKKYKYAKQLLDLDKFLHRLLTILILKVGGVRNWKETLYLEKYFEQRILRLQKKENVDVHVLPNQLEIEVSVPQHPPVTVRSDEEVELLESIGALDKKENAAQLEKEESALELEKDDSAVEFDKTENAAQLEKQESATELEKQESAAELDRKDNVVVRSEIEIKGMSVVVPEPPPVTVGLEVPLRDLKRKLLEEDGVSMLLVTAIGGCGKTTLAKQFCLDEQVKDKFMGNIFFVTVSPKPNLEHIVQQLYQQKGTLVPNNLDRDEAIAIHWLQQFMEESGKNPLLLILDDVWSESEYILEKFDEFKMSNHKILVTSRYEFPRFCSTYDLKSLNHEDAMTLFHHAISLGDKQSCIPEELQEKIVERCKGFPIAITVVGRSLRGQPIEIWQQRIYEWSKGSSILDSEVDLLDRLQSSLDALDKEKAVIKECFMDLGSFPGNHKIPADTLIDIWAELYELGDDSMCIANLYELSSLSLANLVITRKEKMESDGYYSEHFVTQHDMLRDLSVYHTKNVPIQRRERLIVDIRGDNLPSWLTEQKYQPVNARLISITSDGVFSKKWHNIQLPKAEVMVLNFQMKNNALPEFVEKMENLKALIVTNYNYLPAELSNFQLLASLSNLKRIRLEGISIPSITKNPIKLKSLQKLSLHMCNIGQAFSNGTIHVSDVFPNLVEMNIENCNDLVDLPTKLCDLIHLKKLSVTNCHKLSALPEDIGKLLNLEVLRLRSCTELLEFPSSIRNLKNLELLDISNCCSITDLPKDIDELSNLRKLNMRQCLGLQKLPPSILDIELLNYVICDEVTEKLWEPFLHSLKNICITVVKEDMDSSSSLTILSSDNHVATRTEKREMMTDDTLQAKFHAELKSEIKVVKAEMRALKDEFSSMKNQLDGIMDLLAHIKQICLFILVVFPILIIYFFLDRNH